jgi:hypothetical protein
MTCQRDRIRQLSRVEDLEPRRLFAAPGEVLLTVAGPASGHTYHLLERTTWDDAEARAIALGGHLAVVNDQAEQDFLWSTFGPLTGLFWIGITDAAHEGRFVWTTGEPATYTNWFPGEPNNLHPSSERWGNMWIDYAGKWNDLGPDSDQGTLQYAVVEVRNGPDLFATLGNVPDSLDPGGSFALSGALKNLGSANSSGSVRIAYYVSTDATLDGADRLIGEQVASADLAFNASAPISANVVLPAEIQPGTYFLLAHVDANQAIAEADEANNVAVSRAFDVGAVLQPVFRTVRGEVRDADDLPLHGVSVASGETSTFTDYDGRSGKLDRDGVTGDFELADVLIGHNVTFAGAFGRFVPADEIDVALTATAGDLTGATYSRAVHGDEVLTLDTTKPDGGLAAADATVLRPIFLTDYSTVAAGGTLHLHRDLRSDRNSDRISTKPSKALAASARYRRGVEAVTSRLSLLGFRESGDTPLVSVSAIARKSPTERALKLFKEIVAAPVGKPKVTPVVDEATLAALNANNPATAGALWTNVLPPKWSIAPGVTDAYVSRATFEKMRLLAEGSSVAGFVLTRASPSLGGAGKTFRTGREIEFRWIDTAAASQTAGSFWEPIEGFERKDVPLLGGKRLGVPDPSQLGVRWRYVAGYDQPATTSVIQSLLDAGAVAVRFNDPLIIQNIPALKPLAGYDVTIYALF